MGTGNSTPKQIVIPLNEKDEKSPPYIEVSDAAARRVAGLPPLYYTESPTMNVESSQKQQINRDDVYEKTLIEMEKRNAEMFDKQKIHFAKAIEDVEKKFIRTYCSPVCQDLQQQVFECYHQYPKETLICSKEVQAFSNCVESARQNALMRKTS